MEAMTLLAGAALFVSVTNSLLVLLVWNRLESHRNHGARIDLRVNTLETRLGDIGEIKARLQVQSEQISALIERTKSTQDMVHSIQEFLREQNNGR